MRQGKYDRKDEFWIQEENILLQYRKKYKKMSRK